jgi:hypothetical protein
MKRWMLCRDAADELFGDSRQRWQLTSWRNSGYLTGLIKKDTRTKQGHWLYDVDGIKEKMLNNELGYGHHRPPVIENKDEVSIKITISTDLAANLLKRDHDTESAIIQEIRIAVGAIFKPKEASK